MSGPTPLMNEPEPTDDGLRVKLLDSIDFGRSPDLRKEMIALIKQHEPARLVIDLSGVPYMDSSGVATLVEVLQVQTQAGRKLELSRVQPRVRSIFQIARLEAIFTITDDETPDGA